MKTPQNNDVKKYPVDEDMENSPVSINYEKSANKRLDQKKKRIEQKKLEQKQKKEDQKKAKAAAKAKKAKPEGDLQDTVSEPKSGDDTEMK